MLCDGEREEDEGTDQIRRGMAFGQAAWAYGTDLRADIQIPGGNEREEQEPKKEVGHVQSTSLSE